MKSKKQKYTVIALLCGCILFLQGLLCGCGEDPILPTGGYDYRMSSADGAILGYPIPRSGSNPYRYALPLADELPPAFVYDNEKKIGRAHV